MLEIDHRLNIPDAEFLWSFVRSGGPGGQNVNKVASKAVLRWPVAVSRSLPGEVKARLLAQQHRRVTAAGELVVTSQRFRDQERNRLDCLAKVRQIVLQALAVPKARKPTRPSRAAKQARLREKRHRSATKSGRKPPADLG